MSSPEPLAVRKEVSSCSAGQVGAVGGSGCPEGLRPALHVHSGPGACTQPSLCEQGVECGFPCAGWGWQSWEQAHVVYTGGPRHFAAANAPLGWVSLVPLLIHSPSLKVWPHVTASCDGGSHSCRQEEGLLSSLGEEKTELVPWTLESLGERDRVWLCLERMDQTVDLCIF